MQIGKRGKNIISRLVKYGLAMLLVSCIGLVVAYNFFSSEGYLKNSLLPWLAKLSGSEYSAQTIELSLWHATLNMKGIRIGSKDKPFITGDLSGSFSLWKIIFGDIKVDNLVLDNVKVVLKQNSQGKWEIPFGGAAANNPPQQPATPVAEQTNAKEFPVSLHVHNASIKRLDCLLETDDGNRIIISAANFKLPQMKNDVRCPFKLTGKLSISAGSKMQVKAGCAELSGAIRLRPNFMMQRLDLQLKLRQFSGMVNNIALSDNALNATLNSYWTRDGIKIEQLQLKESSQGHETTNIAGTGRLGFRPFALDTAINFDPVSESLTSLITSFFKGYNPGDIKVRYHGKIHYRAGHLKSAGNFYCQRYGNVKIKNKTYSIPKFSLNTVHNIDIDLKRAILRIDNFTATLLQDGRKVIGLNIASTLLGINAVTDQPLSTTLTVNQLDVGIFRLFFQDQPNFIPKTGKLSTKLNLSGTSLKNLLLKGRVDLDNFSFITGNKTYQDVDIHSKVYLNLNDFSTVKLKNWELMINSNNRPLAKLTADKSSFDMKTMCGQIAVELSNLNDLTLQELPIPRQTVIELSKLAPFELKLTASSDIDLRKHHIILNRALLDIKHKSAANINLSLVEPTLFSWGIPHTNKKLTKLRLKISDMTPKTFNNFMAPVGIKFNNGWLNSNIVLSASHLDKGLQLKGTISLYDLDLWVGKHRLRNLQLEQSWDAELNDLSQLEIKHFSGEALLLHQPVLQFEGNGRLDHRNKSGKIHLYFNCPNQQLVNCFTENMFRKLKIYGNIGLTTSDLFKTTLATGQINLTELQTDKLAQPLSGMVAFSVNKDPELLRLKQLALEIFLNRKLLANLSARASQKMLGGRAWENIQLKSSKIDLKLLEAALVTPDKNMSVKKQPPRTEPYHFDFGQQRYLINTDLHGISYGPMVKGKLKSMIYGIGKTIKIAPLQLTMNERILATSGVLRSLPTGIQYNVAGTCRDMNLSPLFQSMIRGKMKNSRATINQLDFKLRGDGIVGKRLWDYMRGNLNVDAKNISFPNTIRDTLLGNLMFLPFDGIAQFQKLMPLRLLRSSLNPHYYANMFKAIKEFNFDHGTIAIRANKRLIYIDKCKFIGPLIQKLQFDGFFGLGSDKTVKLKSTIDLLYLSMNLGIVGTIDNPKLELLKFIPQAVGTNISKLLTPRNIINIFKAYRNKEIKPSARQHSGSQPATSSEKQKIISPVKKVEQLEKAINKTFKYFKMLK